MTRHTKNRQIRSKSKLKNKLNQSSNRNKLNQLEPNFQILNSSILQTNGDFEFCDNYFDDPHYEPKFDNQIDKDVCPRKFFELYGIYTFCNQFRKEDDDDEINKKYPEKKNSFFFWLLIAIGIGLYTYSSYKIINYLVNC